MILGLGFFFSFSKGCYGSEIGQFIIFQVDFTMSLSYFLQYVHGIHYLAVLHSSKRIVIHYFSPPSNLFSLHIIGIFATTTAKILLCQNDIAIYHFLKIATDQRFDSTLYSRQTSMSLKLFS